MLHVHTIYSQRELPLIWTKFHPAHSNTIVT